MSQQPTEVQKASSSNVTSYQPGIVELENSKIIRSIWKNTFDKILEIKISNKRELKEMKEKIMLEEKEEDISIFQNIIHCVEMHGEKLQMKLWDNPSTEEFLSPSIKIAQGILLFYSVKNRKSYEKIKNDLSKIIELGRFDIPIIVIGNHKTSQEREVSYEEAKTWADNFLFIFYFFFFFIIIIIHSLN